MSVDDRYSQIVLYASNFTKQQMEEWLKDNNIWEYAFDDYRRACAFEHYENACDFQIIFGSRFLDSRRLNKAESLDLIEWLCEHGLDYLGPITFQSGIYQNFDEFKASILEMTDFETAWTVPMDDDELAVKFKLMWE